MNALTKRPTSYASWDEDDLREAWLADIARNPRISYGEVSKLQAEVARVTADGRWYTITDIRHRMRFEASDNGIRNAIRALGYERDAVLTRGGEGGEVHSNSISMWRRT